MGEPTVFNMCKHDPYLKNVFKEVDTFFSLASYADDENDEPFPLPILIWNFNNLKQPLMSLKNSAKYYRHQNKPRQAGMYYGRFIATLASGI